jgi:exonuclease V gamma subunit
VTLQEHDATGLDPLEAYQVGAPLLNQLRRGISVETSMDLARARGSLPAGQLGRYEFHQLEYTARALAEIAATLVVASSPSTVTVACDVGGRHVEGAVPDVYGDRRVHLQFARVTGRVILRTWIEHLMLAAHSTLFRTAASTWLVGREDQGEQAVVFRYGPVPDPFPLLTDLVAIFEHGTRTAIPLFPDLAYKFLCSKDSQPSNALMRDWDELLKRDAAVARVFGAQSRLRIDEQMLVNDPNYPLFGETSHRVFSPLMQHLVRLGSNVDNEAV